MVENSFDSAAEFLLDLDWTQLFERMGTNDMVFRCKGCGAIVKRPEREKHFNRHKGVRKRSKTMRKECLKRERIARLEKARSMR